LKERSIGQEDEDEDGSGYWTIISCIGCTVWSTCCKMDYIIQRNCFVECETVIARSLVNLYLLTVMNKTFGLGTRNFHAGRYTCGSA